MAEEKKKYAPGKHPNSIAALKPRKKGQPSPNPKGRPRRGLTISDAMREILQSKDPADGKRIADKVAQTIIGAALKGNYQMMQILLDRVEGKVLQPIENKLTGDVQFVIGRGYANDKPGV